MTEQHVPVLVKESLEYLALKPGQTIVDGTFGAGGHTAELLRAVGPGGKVIALDRDAAAIDAGTHRFKAEVDDARLVLVQARFSELRNVLQELGLPSVDGVLLDLGVSTEQLLSQTRGFSFQHDAPLDMRMDTVEDFTAARLLAEYSEEQLRSLFWTVGERRNAGRIARAIVAARREQPITTTSQLVTVVGKHLATTVFLALRIEVNHELREIERGLEAAARSLRQGGRLIVITFHSLEDGLVKNEFRRWSDRCVCEPGLPVCTCRHEPLCKILTKKPVPVSEREIAENPRARSAKLRACEKL